MEKTHVDNGEGNSVPSAQEFENIMGTHPTKKIPNVIKKKKSQFGQSCLEKETLFRGLHRHGTKLLQKLQAVEDLCEHK